MEFIKRMKIISESNEMKFIDRSEVSQKELANLKVNPDYPLINISAKDKNRVGWGASNFSLSAYEVVIGFSEGSDPAYARIFAQKVINQLGTEWQVYKVPSGRGAMPICQQ